MRTFLEQEKDAGRLRSGCDCWMSGVSPELSATLGRRGWVGMTLPVTYGGGGRTPLERLVVSEELLAAGAPVAAHWFADRQVGPALVRHGTERQKSRYLPGITAGTCYFAIGMSEPDSGSDLASIRTTAVRVADGWKINGRKIWTTHAQFAHFVLALVRTAPRRDGDRHGGLSQLIVDLRAPGVSVRPIATLDGAAHFNEVLFDDVLVEPEGLLGVEGNGWAQVVQELGFERSGPERFLSTMPLLRAMLSGGAEVEPRVGVVLAEVQALRHMSADLASSVGHDRSAEVRAALVKDVGTRLESAVVALARWAGRGRPDPSSPDEFARLLGEAVLHAPDGTLRGGTNEILRGIVARSLVAS